MTAGATRRTRPANRRAIVAREATDLFGARGYEHVSMSEIADVVGFAPSALYRHFPGKKELLVAVVIEQIDAFDTSLETSTASSIDELADELADFGLAHRTMGTLWQRETRHLPRDTQAALRGRVRSSADGLAAAIGVHRPELAPTDRSLLAWAALAVLMSPSFHRAALPPSALASTMATLVSRSLRATLCAPLVEAAPPAAGRPPWSRREALLVAAVRLFAERSFAGVGIEEVGGALGITGPSVYNHFESKHDILMTALVRGANHLQTQLTQVLSATSDPASVLAGLARAHASFAFAHRDLMSLLVSEVRNLREPDHTTLVGIQRDYLAEWVHLLVELRPELDQVAARVEVHAALALIQDLSRTPHLRIYRDIPVITADLGLQVLGVPIAPTTGERR